MNKLKFFALALIAVLCTACPGPEPDPVNPSHGSGISDTPVDDYTKYGISTSREVDLGLSVNWAGWNVGANEPKGYGGYYAFGEIEEKDDDEYTYDEWEFKDVIFIGSLDYYDDESGIRGDISETPWDVAREKWGDAWRMPTVEELEELVDKCEWEKITIDGINGSKIIGPNGNSIFLPLGGVKDVNGPYEQGNTGHLRASCTPTDIGIMNWGSKPYIAAGILFVDSSEGLNVRPVKSKPKTGQDKYGINTTKTVDLGLSVKWAGWNIGAAKPEDTGNYYAFGETKPKSSYTESNYKVDDIYSEDGVDISGTEYDVARTEWGGNWRIPTYDEAWELQEKCMWKPVMYKGVLGSKVTGPNGNSIFLPATGIYCGNSKDYRTLTDCVYTASIMAYNKWVKPNYYTGNIVASYGWLDDDYYGYTLDGGWWAYGGEYNIGFYSMYGLPYSGRVVRAVTK